MGYESFIALRYLRGKRRSKFVSVITFISIIGITVGVTALIIVLSVMDGFQKDIRDKILGISAHVVVMEFGGEMGNYEKVSEEIRKNPQVLGATPFIYRQAMLSGPGGVMGVVVRGLDPDTVTDVTVLKERIKYGALEGVIPSFKEAAIAGEVPGIVIGAELAGTLGADIGDEVKIVSPSSSASAMGSTPRMAAFKVAAIFEMGMFEYDSSMAFISIKNAQSFFRTGKVVTGIEVKIQDVYEAEDISEEIVMDLEGPYWSRTWMDMNRNLFSALKMEKAAMFIILTLVILVAALNIISTLIMVVMEKGKEIAILKGLGASSKGIMKIFMIEGIIIGFVGTFLGGTIGVISAIKLEAIVGVIEEIFGFKVLDPSVYYIDKFPSNVDPVSVAFILLMTIGISFLATIYPSWKASRLDPVEGLRYE
ncbi:MAG: lipoprotein-releasing ABC transporter permease subunit [Deltaproteobacteria bacterium]|nr:lipoprotein-releasing ABC transporter permease subunit [Deltaproteobacteria bacterium]